MTAPLLRRVADEPALARAAAHEIFRHASEAVRARGAFTLALTGGTTPRVLYRLLADASWRARMPWDRTHVFFGDERCVPPDHPDSNFGMARDALLAHVAPASVHRLEGEREPSDAAARAEADLRETFGDAGLPRLDLVLLGLGADAHVASLFPGHPALDERQRWVVAPFVPHLGAHRITMTLPVLNAASAVLFLVAGRRKADALARMLSPPPGEEPPPAARVRPAQGELVILADEEACGVRAGGT